MLFLFAQRSALKNAAKITLLITLTLSFFFNSTVVGQVAAEYLNVVAPSSVLRNNQFEVSLDISTKPNATYFLKGRLGSAPNQLTKGQTLVAESGIWLSDSVNWTSFPTFVTNSEGHWSGKITLKTSSSVSLGNNFLAIRIKNSSDSSITDSSAFALTVNEAIAPDQAEVTKPSVSIGEPILNEFMPSPASGGKEWVEIKNNSTSSADISGWKIDDEPGKSLPEVLPAGTIIGPGAFLVVTFSSAKLNDLADSVRLLKPDDSEVESYRYTGVEKGKSYAKDLGGNWFTTDKPTPNSQNPKPPITMSTQNNNQAISKSPPQSAASETKNNPETATVPRVRGISTTSTHSATIAAASKSKLSSNSRFSLALIILGFLLTILGIIFVIKRKSGHSTSEQPLGVNKI